MFVLAVGYQKSGKILIFNLFHKSYMIGLMN